MHIQQVGQDMTAIAGHTDGEEAKRATSPIQETAVRRAEAPDVWEAMAGYHGGAQSHCVSLRQVTRPYGPRDSPPPPQSSGI